jgi:hypothetical protein
MLGKVNIKLVILLFILAGLMSYVVIDGFVSGSAIKIPQSASSASGSATKIPQSASAASCDVDKLIKAIEPKIIDTVKGTIKKELASKDAVMTGSSGSLKMEKLPNPAQPPAKPTDCSPASEQGADYMSNCKPFNINEWIRKDSIPCYGCTLPA